MIKIVLKIFMLVFGFTALSYSQNFSTLWQSHYSYNNIIDVVKGESKIYAAAQNAIFEYDVSTEEIKTITTVEGLSGQQITTIYYSEIYQSLIIGYETGLIEVYSETDGSVLSAVDILEKQNITPNNKRINHFYEHNGLVYIAANYGISVYDLERLEFGDTYFLGNGGIQITVEQITVYNNEIYAACLNNNGIKRGNINNSNLIDFQQWETVNVGNFHSINTLNDKVYAVRDNRVIYEIDGTSVTTLNTLPSLPLDSKTINSNILYTTTNRVYIYDENLQLTHSFLPTQNYTTRFTSAVQVGNFVYIGTKDFGVLRILISESENYTEIKPNGPIENNIFRINAETQTVWVTYGEYSQELNPYPLTSKGISYLNDDIWNNIPYDSLLGTRELNIITPNIFNPNQVFVSSFFNGILEFNNFEPTIQLNETNSGLESLVLEKDPDYVDIRVSKTLFDRNGLLWSITSLVDRPLKSYDPITGNWQSYSFTGLIQSAGNNNGFFDMAIGNDGTKWIGSYSSGLIAYNENITNNPLRNINSESQNVLPFTRFTAVTLDNRNQLWLGTTNGLRVLYNTSGFYNDANPSLSQIIIIEDGIPRELLDDQSITNIEVDGSNNKWIGTVSSGIFYFSSDGQNTIYHFTTSNSPLPSNTINDISIDSNNGIVYIATNRGLLAFTSGGSGAKETLESAFVYPNPVRPEYNILGSNTLNDINKGIKISGLTDRVNIKITDIEGNLVAEAQSNINLRASNTNYNFAIDGGTAIWNGKNLGNSVVATGIYLIMISDLDSFETKVLKVLIVR